MWFQCSSVKFLWWYPRGSSQFPTKFAFFSDDLLIFQVFIFYLVASVFWQCLFTMLQLFLCSCFLGNSTFCCFHFLLPIANRNQNSILSYTSLYYLSKNITQNLWVSLTATCQNITQIPQGDLKSTCFIWVRTLHRFLWVILHQFVSSGSEHHTDSLGYCLSDASLRFLRQPEGQMNCKHQCVENQRPWGSSLPAEGIKFSPLF